MSRRTWFLALAILTAVAAVELAMGRNGVCTCGTVTLWVGARDSPQTSQMLADWYSLSHIVHGLLFYAALWLVARRWPVERRFLIAMLVEAGWEVIENTPMVIDRYRATTAALGYTGDSVINSLSDTAFMIVGFAIARLLPVPGTVVVAVALELFVGWSIRDNLTLNLIMLIHPVDAIRTWQAGG